MASGSGKINLTWSGFYWNYTYSTREDTNNVYVDITMYLNTSSSWSTASTPGFAPCAIPDVRIDSMPTSAITDTTGEQMNAWIKNKGGVGTVQWISDGSHSAGKYFNTNLTAVIPKQLSARTCALSIGAAIQSTYQWDNFYGEVSVNISIPSKYTAPSNFSIAITSKNTTSATVKATWTEGTGDSTATINISGKTGTIASSGGTTTINGLTSNTSYTVSGSLSDGTTTLSASTSVKTDIIPPSDFSISISSKNTTLITVKGTWTNGSIAATATIKIGNSSKTISSSGGTVTFTGLTPNTSYSISGSLSDGATSALPTSVSGLTDIAIPSSWTTVTNTTTSTTIGATSSNGGSFKYQYRIQKSGSWSSWQDSGTFSSLSSNTNYPVEARCVNTSNSAASGSLSGAIWTYPIVNTPSVSLKSGSEHNTINVSASAFVASSYDQFAYSINNGSWSSWTTSKTNAFNSLSGNTSYSIRVKMRNTSSGFESDAKSASVTTWHNPLTSLVVNLTNSWFWYLSINSSYTYTGTISKYEFAIGDDQSWVSTGTNSHSRGSTSSTGSGKLSYNTNYNCSVRLTDNHGRVYTSEKRAFKTLDERPLYVNGQLREVKVIKPDNSIVYITPNLLTIIKPDGTTINMNKIINNDDRIDH